MSLTVFVSASGPIRFRVDDGPLREAGRISVNSKAGPLVSVDVTLPDRSVEQYRDVHLGRLDGDGNVDRRCRECRREGE